MRPPCAICRTDLSNLDLLDGHRCTRCRDLAFEDGLRVLARDLISDRPWTRTEIGVVLSGVAIALLIALAAGQHRIELLATVGARAICGSVLLLAVWFVAHELPDMHRRGVARVHRGRSWTSRHNEETSQ